MPRFEVRLYLNDAFLGQSRVDDEGNWVITLSNVFSVGEQILRVDQTIGDGTVQLRIEQPFTIGEALDPSTAESGVVVQPGNTLWNIARQLYGTGVRYTVIFKENTEQIRDPDLIYPGQLFQLPERPADKPQE